VPWDNVSIGRLPNRPAFHKALEATRTVTAPCSNGLGASQIELKGVPLPMPPGRRDLRGLFQHHMRPALLGQIVTDGQPGLSAANDHGLDLLRHVCPPVVDAYAWPYCPPPLSRVKQHLPRARVDERLREWPNDRDEPRASARRLPRSVRRASEKALVPHVTAWQ
jgi:hypothetical protein